jgi:signal transduction histidine kinase
MPNGPRPSDRYRFPRAATIERSDDLLKIAAPLLKANVSPGLLVDLSQLERVDSFGMTLLAACFHSLISSRIPGSVRRPAKEEVHLQLLDMGLYESIGIGDRFEPRRPSRDRVDLVHIKALQPEFINSLLDFLERMQPFEEGLRPSMRMALLELIQNFSEHAKASLGAWVTGQFSPQLERITLSVLDSGIGIPESLRIVPRYRNYGDERLIELATLEGVTSVEKSSRGLGLSTIRRFVEANKGTLTILSGNARMIFSPNGEVIGRKIPAVFRGTAVFLSLLPTERGLYSLQ